MNNIVFPTDFSENSLKAFDFALKHLSNGSTKFIVINVYRMPAGAASGAFFLLEEMHKQAEIAMKEFEHLVRSNYPEQNLNLSFKVLQGDFETQCNAVAIENQSDCIVVGTKGASGIKEVLVGSNTVGLIRGLKVPLFVIPFDYLNNPMENFVFSFDGKDPLENAQSQVRKFAKWFKLPVKSIHIKVSKDELPIEWDVLSSIFKDLDFTFDTKENESVEAGLKEIVQNENGILCMIRHKQSFWEKVLKQSDSRKAIMHADIPILVIPEHK